MQHLCLLDTPLDETRCCSFLADEIVAPKNCLSNLFTNLNKVTDALVTHCSLLLRLLFIEVGDHDTLLIVPQLAQNAHSDAVHAEDELAPRPNFATLLDHTYGLILPILEPVEGCQEL